MVLMGITEFWGCFKPGLEAIGPAVPVIALLITAVLATAAFFTFRLRARVDHVDQWWKQVNVAVDKGLMDDADANTIADRILETLQSKQPPQRPLKWINQKYNKAYPEEYKAYRKALRKYKREEHLRWKISAREERLLMKITETFAFRVLDDGEGGIIDSQ